MDQKNTWRKRNESNIDINGVWRMSKPSIFVSMKMKVSIRVTDYFNVGRHFTIEQFQHICDNWRTGVEGLETKCRTGIGRLVRPNSIATCTS